jgi:cytochrome c peroxidase
MKKLLVVIITFFIFAFKTEKELFFVPKNWPTPVYNFSTNTVTVQKILLGRVLFYDPALSKNNTVSCASCHSQYSAFTHIDHALSHGINDSIGTRNSPALMNLAWQKTFMWDGAINNLDMQALAPISHPAEMGSTITDVIKKLNSLKTYRSLFYNAYGDSLATGEKTLKAFSQFLVTIISANSKYDKVMHQQEKFTPQETNGYALFKKNCSACHTEPLFTTNQFANNGLPLDTLLKDYGRYKITKNTNDSLKFKIPTLRNIEFTYPYMHDGRFKKLSEVLNHYTTNIHSSKTLAVELQKPIVLTSNEKVDLISFLLTLTDREFIFNKKFSYPNNK